MKHADDIYSRITQKIIDDLEKGELTWRKPWSSSVLAGNVMCPLRWNDIPYTGINVIMLWATAAEKGFASPYWMTFKQASDLGGHIRKGEKGSTVVYADKIEKEETAEDGSTSIQKIPFLKQYTVFNVSQIEGLAEEYYNIPEPRVITEDKRIEAVDQFFAYTKAQVRTGNIAAYYQSGDYIEMPPFEAFDDPVRYYGVFAHELTHWTKHPNRLSREFNRKSWGDEGYAREELVAELGACFLGAELGFEPTADEQHAAYIKSWLRVLKNDKRFIFQAASFAQKAVEYVTGLQPIREKTVVKNTLRLKR